MARTQSRTRDAVRPTGGLVRPGLTTAEALEVEIGAFPGCDFLMSLCEWGDEAELLPDDRRWRDESRKALLAELGGDSIVDSTITLAPELAGFMIRRPGVRTATDVVELVHSLSDEELQSQLFDELLTDPELGPIATAGLAGDAGAYAELSSRLAALKGHPVLPPTPAEAIDLIRRAVDAWLPYFRKVEDRVTRMVERDVAGRAKEKARSNPFGFIEEVTNGLRYSPEPGIRRYCLVPSYFNRPYNTVSNVGDTRVVVYPISDEALDAADRLSPSPATVRIFRALGDESRLRILRLLAGRDWYLTELANELDVSKPTMKHHLAQLRGAGLVTVTELGNLTYYSLRRDRLTEGGAELRAYLGL